MKNRYHILNGDSLRHRFPEEIDGEIIVVRECFMDGEVESDSLDGLFKMRAGFITELYGDYTIEDYYSDTVSEFEKVQRIPEKSAINLWFEDDLFCQVNCWFVVNLISNCCRDSDVFLIRPAIHTQYGFGGLNESELIEAYQQKTRILEIDKITGLWNAYQKNETEKLIRTAKELEPVFPFIYRAAAAHIDRIPTENNPGRPVRSLIEIMEQLGTGSFGPVFREFCKREYIYGYGDLQVKHLLEKIKNTQFPGIY